MFCENSQFILHISTVLQNGSMKVPFSCLWLQILPGEAEDYYWHDITSEILKR